MPAVMVTGPCLEINRFGDEFPVWSVFIAGNHPADDQWMVYTYREAVELAEKIAQSLGVECVLEGSHE